MKIDLIRHTTPLVEPGVCYGQADLDLVASFDSEREAVFERLEQPVAYAAVYASPLQRCWRLAEFMEPAPVAVPELMEYNFGAWELRRWADIDRSESDLWSNDVVNVAPPGGETLAMMKARVDAFFDQLITDHGEDQRVAVVTHSGVQRLLFARVFEIPLERMFQLRLGFGAVVTIDYRDRWDRAAFTVLNP